MTPGASALPCRHPSISWASPSASTSTSRLELTETWSSGPIHLSPGDNRLDLLKLKSVVTSIFGVKNTELAVFHDETEIQNETDLLSLSGKTLCVTTGSAPSLISSSSTLLCQYINLQLLNAEPQECLMGTVGTLLLENPLGQNGLTHQGLLYEAAKVFGLRSRKLKLFLNETQTQEITEDIPVKTLNMKTVYVSVLPTTADF